jgi:hypothetical protein
MSKFDELAAKFSFDQNIGIWLMREMRNNVPCGLKQVAIPFVFAHFWHITSTARRRLFVDIPSKWQRMTTTSVEHLFARICKVYRNGHQVD